MARGKKNGTVQIPAGAHTFNRELPCDLSPEESQQKGAKAAKIEQEADDLQAEIASSLKEKRADLKAKRGAVRQLLKEIAAGTEDRTVRCYEEKDFRNNEVKVIRADTGEVVERRGMDPVERQEELPTAPKRGRRKAAEQVDDEQDEAAE